MNIRLVAYTVGLLLLVLGILMVIPLLYEIYDGSANINAFLTGVVCTLFSGGMLFFSNRGSGIRLMGVREAFALTTLSWCALSLFGALPLFMADIAPSFTDAFFESLSGLTTTGSTVFAGLDDMSRGILIWRSLLQWLGGIGVIGMAIAILPFLGVGGMQLFRTESSDRSEKILPRPGQFAFTLLSIYGGLTMLCGIAYYAGGITRFDAFAHALTTLSTGGYSTHDASLGYFKSYGIYWTATIFMFMGGLPFALYARTLIKGDMQLFRDSQVRTFTAMVALLTLIIAVWLWATSGAWPFWDAVTYTAFSIVSIITTTGYAISDYTTWGPFAIGMFFFITYLGGCAGSTSGGIKTVRFEITARAVRVHMRKLLYPHGVFILHYGGKAVDPRDVRSVMSFLFVFVAANVIMTLALALTGLDFYTSLSGAATAIANVGPGVGNIIGPAGNFSSLPATAKWILCFGMLIGRLELLTVLVLFSPYFWRR